jgi:hypothetical protein
MRLTPYAWLAFTLAQLGLGAGRGSRVTQSAPAKDRSRHYTGGYNKTRECERRMRQIERGEIFASKQIKTGFWGSAPTREEHDARMEDAPRVWVRVATRSSRPDAEVIADALQMIGVRV